MKPRRPEKQCFELLSCDGWTLSESLICQKNWRSLILPDFPEPIEIKRLSQYSTLRNKSFLYIVANGGAVKTVTERILSTKSEIKKSIHKYINSSIVFFDESTSYVYFKSSDNQYRIISGEAEFVEFCTHHIKYDVYEEWKIFFNYEDADSEKIEELEYIWNSYTK